MNAAPESERRVAAERIAQVRARFLANLPTRLGGLVELAVTAGGEGADAAEARESLRIGLHNLAGSAPTLGLVAIGRRAGEIERLVISKQLPNGALPKPIAADVARDVASLADAASEPST